MKLLKLPQVLGITAKSRTSHYADIKAGLMTPPVKISEHAVAWPDGEVAAINAARIAGKPDEEIRQLVIRLVADRQNLAR